MTTTAERVDLKPLQDAYQERGISPSELARRMGWVYDTPGRRNRADSGRVLRYLGLKPDVGRGFRKYRETITYDMLLALAEAMDVDPVDVGA